MQTHPQPSDEALERLVQLVEQKLLGELRLLQQKEHEFLTSYSSWQMERENPHQRAQLILALCSILALSRQLSHFGDELADLQEDLGIECRVPETLLIPEPVDGA